MQFQGYEERVVPRTIGREQDARLRELAERTGRSIAKLVREAVERDSKRSPLDTLVFQLTDE